MTLTLRVSAGLDDGIGAMCLRIKKLDESVLFDRIQVDLTGAGDCLYDRLSEMSLRASVVPYAPWKDHQREAPKKW